MSYDGPEAWRWSERLNGSWDYGNGYNIAIVDAAGGRWAIYAPTDDAELLEDGQVNPRGDPDFGFGLPLTECAKRAAEAAISRHQIRERCAWLELERSRAIVVAAKAYADHRRQIRQDMHENCADCALLRTVLYGVTDPKEK